MNPQPKLNGSSGPAFGQNPPGLSANPPHFVPGGIGARFLALIIDGFLCGIVNYPVSFGLALALGFSPESLRPEDINSTFWLLQGLSLLISMAIPFVYFGFFYSTKGASLGKMALGLKVVDARDGTNLSFLTGALRDSVGKLLSAFFLIGYLIAFFRGDKRALHDLIVGSQVISTK